MGNIQQRPGEVQRREEEMANMVMAYLSEHPMAMDTLRGVAEWWVMRQQVQVDVRTLARVLQQLTEKGLLEKFGTGEQARYTLKRNQA